jgi:hypothetical protein
MKLRRQIAWLGIGIGSIAMVVGYMVGGSQTPVVSVAVPVVFGLVITALGFVGGSGSDKKLDALNEFLDRAKTGLPIGDGAETFDLGELKRVENTVNSIKEQIALTPERIGKVLVLFTAFYVIGLSFGTYARVRNLYAARLVKKLPWESGINVRRPPTSADAIDWINLQEQLLEAGYTPEQVADVYLIQIDEWNKAQSPTVGGPPDPTPKKPNQDVSPNDTAAKPRLSAKLKTARNGGQAPQPLGFTVIGTSVLPLRVKPSPTESRTAEMPEASPSTAPETMKTPAASPSTAPGTMKTPAASPSPTPKARRLP